MMPHQEFVTKRRGAGRLRRVGGWRRAPSVRLRCEVGGELVRCPCSVGRGQWSVVSRLLGKRRPSIAQEWYALSVRLGKVLEELREVQDLRIHSLKHFRKIFDERLDSFRNQIERIDVANPVAKSHILIKQA